MHIRSRGPKNIIVISVDDLRFDCISCEENRIYLKRYGVEGETDTPNIDWFAAHGVRFSQAIAPASYTSPSHASLLTGLYPPRHGVRAFFYTKMRENVRTLAEVLKDHGYRTFSSCDFYNMFNTLDLARGVDVRGTHDNAEIMSALEKHSDEKIFLFFHLFDVHDPYGCSKFEIHPGYNDDAERGFEELRAKYHIDSSGFLETVNKAWERGYKSDVVSHYIRGVNKFDRGRFTWIIKALRRIGILEDALVIITADHGEADCGQTFSHGADLCEEVIRVPLIFYCPGMLPEGEVVDQQCSLVDVVPTILDLAGIEPDEPLSCDGRSLLATMIDGSPFDSKAYSERWGHNISNEEMKGFGKQCAREQALLPPFFDVLLTHRSLRTPDYKLLVRGNEPDAADLTGNEAFLKWAFHTILYNHADPNGFAYWLDRLNHHGLNRAALLDAFTTVAENRYALFDIRDDPFERNDLAGDRRHLSMSGDFLETIQTIERSHEAGDLSTVSFESAEEARHMETQLRALGYM